MGAGVYDKRDLYGQSFWQKIFGKMPKQNYVCELENLLCANEANILAIKISDVDALKAKYKVSNIDFERERKMLFNKYFDYCLTDERLSDEEKAILAHLCLILNIDKAYVDERIAERGADAYRSKVRQVIADDKVTDEERGELKTVQGEFNLSVYDSNNIYDEECRKKMEDFVNLITERRRMSPDDEQKLRDMQRDMQIDMYYSTDGLSQFRHLWDIENAPLVELCSPIALQKTEHLYYTNQIEWYEERKRTTYVSYGGVSTSFRIMKGVTLRSGMIAPTRHSEDYMKQIDTGRVYLTNKRIIFTGEHGNKNIPWTKVLDITVYRDGIEIGKDTGRKPFFQCSDVEEMGLYITRLMNDH